MNPMGVSPIMPKLKKLVEIASHFIGVTEEGKDNYGAWVEEFQKAVDGKAQGEPWCMGFIQYCIKRVEKGTFTKSLIYKSESVMQVWDKTPQMCRLEEPMPGAIMLWQMYDKDNNPTSRGHAEIVVEVVSKGIVKTIGGNTSDSQVVDRNGDGVYYKMRSITGSDKMRVVGWLLPWV